MKKTFKFYATVWAIMFAVYNLIVLLIRPLPGYEINYDARFWVSWAVVVLAYCAQIGLVYSVFKSEKLDDLFFGIPLLKTCYSALVALTVIPSVCMLIPDFPWWAAAIICAVILLINTFAVLKAQLAGDVVADTDKKIKANTLFVKMLTADAQSLLARASSDEAKSALTGVYEAIRYSDPMSSDALSGVESQITLRFSELKTAVEAGDEMSVAELAKDIVILIGDRNNKCKLLK